MLLASTAAGLPDWDLSSLRSSHCPDRSVISGLYQWPFQQDTWSHYTALAAVDKAGLEFTETRLSAGIKATGIMPSPGAFLSCRCSWIALEFFSSFLDSWSRPRDSSARLITFSSPLGLWKKTACLWGSATLSVHCSAF